MSCKKLSKCFILLPCVLLVKSNMLYQRKTDLDYRRQGTTLSYPVVSLSVCARQCAEKTQCVSFFFNPLESLCQTEGRIYLSFDERNAGPWQYYGMYHLRGGGLCGRVVKTSVSYHEVSHQQAASVRILLVPC
jgi:hypothetical protein